MGAPKKTVIKVSLACADCATRNYSTTKSKQVKNKQGIEQRLELKKYCHRCDAHTLHRETK